MAQGEGQPLAQRVGARRELLGRNKLQNIHRWWQTGRLTTHAKNV